MEFIICVVLMLFMLVIIIYTLSTLCLYKELKKTDKYKNEPYETTMLEAMRLAKEVINDIIHLFD